MTYAFALLAALVSTKASAPPRIAPHATAAPSAAATVPATPLARARLVFEQLRTNSLDRTLLTEKFSSELTPEVASSFARDLAVLGKPLDVTEVGRHQIGGTATYDFAVAFAAGVMTMTLGIDDASDRVSRLVLRRALGTTRVR